MTTYDSLHRQARTLESLFDTKLTAYARAGSSISRAGNEDVEASGSTARWRDMETEVDELLEKVRCHRSFWERGTHNSIPLAWRN